MTNGKTPARGQVAPDFELPDSTGQQRRLSDLAAQSTLVLLFYRGYWWPFCLRQLADYAKHYEEIRAAGAEVVAVSVDPPQKSEAVRRELHLPFAILSDTNKQVIQDWDIYNPKERGGIAKPAVFVIDRDCKVLFASVDKVNSRVPTIEIVRILQTHDQAASAARKSYFPSPMDFVRAIRNGIRMRGA